jgi:hypothetical protein
MDESSPTDTEDCVSSAYDPEFYRPPSLFQYLSEEHTHQLTGLSVSDNLAVWRSLGTMASTACLTFMAQVVVLTEDGGYWVKFDVRAGSGN